MAAERGQQKLTRYKDRETDLLQIPQVALRDEPDRDDVLRSALASSPCASLTPEPQHGELTWNVLWVGIESSIGVPRARGAEPSTHICVLSARGFSMPAKITNVSCSLRPSALLATGHDLSRQTQTHQ